jgi:hypothetical protein
MRAMEFRETSQKYFIKWSLFVYMEGRREVVGREIKEIILG